VKKGLGVFGIHVHRFELASSSTLRRNREILIRKTRGKMMHWILKSRHEGMYVGRKDGGSAVMWKPN
jgi:hypothetical protein